MQRLLTELSKVYDNSGHDIAKLAQAACNDAKSSDVTLTERVNDFETVAFGI
jgi:hypothetical protein